MDSHNHKSFAIESLRKTGKLVHSDGLFCAGLSADGSALRIMAASVHGDAERLALLLSDPAALPDFANGHGITPLMAAAARGHAAVVELLAAHPLVNIARAGADGWTALHYAAWFDEEKAAASLIAHHAPLDAATRGGKTPFDCARGKKTEAVFWRQQNFVRHMKLHHPEFQDFPTAATDSPSAPAVKPEAAAETDPLKDAFFRAVTGVGLQWQLHPSLNARAALVQKLARMKGDELKSSYKTIRNTAASFDWSGVFIAAAAASNVTAMRFLHDEMLFEARTLNQALSAVVQAGDDRNAAHHLLIWGANPAAPFEIDAQLAAPNIFEAAFRKGRGGIFEELVLWRGDRLSKSDAFRYANLSILIPYESGDMEAATALYAKKLEVKKLPRGKLQAAFSKAVDAGDIARIMAAYAEAREDRLLRGRVEFSKTDGGGAIAVALRHERYEFARLLIADGYRLRDAPLHLKFELKAKGSEKAKQFAEDHLSGKMQIESVEDVGRKRRAELRVMYIPGMYGGHYGRF